MKRLFLLPLLLAAFDSALGAPASACYPNLITPTAPDNRYTDNGDGTVTDTVTRVMWKQCAEGLSTTTTPCDTGTHQTFTWQAALQQAASVNTGGGYAGYTDWRVPSVRELQSLIERACVTPSINSTLFPNTLSTTGNGITWSSSPVAGASGMAWYVNFVDGGGNPTGGITNPQFLRLVRDR